MKSLFVFFYIIASFNIQANILNIENTQSYNLFQNYKKVGVETKVYKKKIFFTVNIDLDIKVKDVSHKFLYEISYKDSNYKNKLYAQLKVDNKNKAYYKFHQDKSIVESNKYQYIKLSKNTYLFEPLLVSTLYPLLKSSNKKIKIFIPSKNRIVDAKIKLQGIETKKIEKKEFTLKKYNLTYENQSFEIFIDKLERIVFVDWSSLGYSSEINKSKIVSFKKTSIKKNYKLKIKNRNINGFLVKEYHYISKFNKLKINNKILIIDGTMFPKMKNASLDTLAENIFFDKVINKLSKKGYTILRYSFEGFNSKQLETLSLNKKYNIVKKLFSKNKKHNTIITIGWGSILALRLSNDFSSKIKKIIFLNPTFYNYLKILENQVDLEFFTLKKKKQLKSIFKKLIKRVSLKDKIIFNNLVINSEYFRELFKENIKKYLKNISNKVKISVFTTSYDSEISSKNGWYLYSNIKNNNIESKTVQVVKHKEFIGLSHYFYKIPYKSFAFSYNKNLKIDRGFLKELTRFLKK